MAPEEAKKALREMKDKELYESLLVEAYEVITKLRQFPMTVGAIKQSDELMARLEVLNLAGKKYD